MAKERTDVSCYQSRFGAEWITAAQYLAENMCSRKARSEGNDLADFFWQEEYWKREFLKQKRLAEALLADFDIQSIVAALRHPDAKRVYSFGLHSVLLPLIQRCQRQLDVQEQIKEDEGAKAPESVDVYKRPRKPFGSKKSELQKLRELENEKS